MNRLKLFELKRKKKKTKKGIRHLELLLIGKMDQTKEQNKVAIRDFYHNYSLTLYNF